MALRLSPHMTVMANAAQRASKRLLRDFAEVEQLQVSVKGPSDFVSQADLRAEAILKEDLGKARPGYGFLMEEEGASGSDNWTWRWVVDPRSTRHHQLPARHPALVHQHRPRAPARRRLHGMRRGADLRAGQPTRCSGPRRGVGAFMNEKRLRVSARRELKDSVLATGIPFAAVDPRNRLALRPARSAA